MSSYYGSEMSKYEKSRFHVSIFRALAAVPPIFAALFVSNLGKITDYTGLTGFMLAFVFPSLLCHFSKKKLLASELPVKTIHSGFMTCDCMQGVLLIVGVGLLVYVGATLIYFSV